MIGSVFSPYYAWSGRHDPENYVGLNVGLYGGGKKRWTLTERGKNDLVQEQRYLRMGPSDLVWENGCLTVNIREWANPIFRKVTGQIKLYPNALVTNPFQLDGQGRHFWQPLGAVSRAEVSFSDPSLNWSGPAYIDSNWGSEPLETGFRYWDWSRGHSARGAHILYDAFTRKEENRQLSLLISNNGEVDHCEIPERQQLKRGPIWRVRRSTLADKGVTPKTVQMLEDTPFYTRSRLETVMGNEHVIAVHESLDLDRFDSRWVKSLLPFRMPRKTS